MHGEPPTTRATPIRRAPRGAGLVEALVGTLIGLVVTVVMLDVLAGAEGVERSAAGLAAAQEAGALAAFTLGVEIANAGNGLAAAARELATCPDTGAIATTLRPIPVLITAGSTPDAPDAIVVNYAAAAALAGPMPLAGAAPAGSEYRVRAPTGFAAGDALVTIGPGGRCAASTAVAVSAPDGAGVVAIAAANRDAEFPAASVLLDLGPQDRRQRVRYDVANGTLRSLDLTTPGATPNPLASDVLNLKLQYGVDTDGDGFLDRWVSAAAAPWDPTSVLAASAATLARIKAVRLGLVVRSPAFERDVRAPYDWVLFDCAGADAASCPGRLAGTLPPHWRYRTYETVIPLRNAIWNARP